MVILILAGGAWYSWYYLSFKRTPTISTVSPDPARNGDLIFIAGSGFAATDTILFNGINAGSYSSSNGKSISLALKVPYTYVQRRPNCVRGKICPEWIGAIMLIEPQIVDVVVADRAGSSNAFPLRIATSTTNPLPLP